MAFEVNFDSIVGPTHNYSGLSYGNIASMQHQKMISNPKEAALQGLEKMKFLADLGIKQAILPPHERPSIQSLRALGFFGSDQEILTSVQKQDPLLLNICSSSAAMWAANSATVAPSSDTKDGLLHFTPANLSTYFHRTIESSFTGEILKKIFTHPAYFVHHAPLPAGEFLADEGAANHTRFCKVYAEAGLHLFVYGRSSHSKKSFQYPARQTLEASQAIARLHELSPDSVIFAEQNPMVINQGVFHNDVIAVGNENVFFYHEEAFVDTHALIQKLQSKLNNLICIPVTSNQIPVSLAVQTYLFNSQIITLPNQVMQIIAPSECQDESTVKALLDEIVQSSSNPINKVHYLNLRESMRNGGGPACLRLRVIMNEEEWKHMHSPVILTGTLYLRLKEWIKKYYRDRLSTEDLSDPQLLMESRFALEELTQILQLGSLYSFQK